MPIDTTRVDAEAMFKRRTDLHPDECPEVYAMQCEGHCLTPVFMDGAKLKFSKSEPYRNGDYVAIWIKPEFVPEGDHQVIVKRLVMAPPAEYFRRGPSMYVGCKPVLLAEFHYPHHQRIRFDPEKIMGIHKCLGEVTQPTTKVRTDALKGEHSMRIAASAGISRRAMLGQSAALMLVAPLPAVAAPSRVVALHSASLAAQVEADAAWGRFNVIEEASASLLPKVRVQVGRYITTNEDTGEKAYVPRYAYTEEAIERDYHPMTSTSGFRSPSELARAGGWCERRDRDIAELRRLRALRDAAEAECGLTAAEEDAKEASTAANDAVCALLETRPATVDEAGMVAGHLLDLLDDCLADENDARAFLKTLSGRQA